MLLAGIIITIAFIMTALTLSQVSALEREAASQQTASITLEWRFLRDRLASNLNTAATPDMADDTFKDFTFPAIAETFRAVESEKGFDVVMRLAGNTISVNKTEYDLIPATGTTAVLRTADGKYTLPIGVTRDGDDDGLIHYAPCEDPAGPVAGCVNAMLVVVHLFDGKSTIEEVLLVGTNRV